MALPHTEDNIIPRGQRELCFVAARHESQCCSRGPRLSAPRDIFGRRGPVIDLLRCEQNYTGYHCRYYQPCIRM